MKKFQKPKDKNLDISNRKLTRSILNLRERKNVHLTDCVCVKKVAQISTISKTRFYWNKSKLVFIHPLKIILPKIKLQLCKQHRKWLTNSFSPTNIFLRCVPKVTILKETFTMRNIPLV